MSESADELQALLGRGTHFEGLLAFEGRVRLDGGFKGKIRSEGILILGAGADVDADVQVGSLIVRGGILRGDVKAQNLIEIHADGQVFGDIRAAQIDIDKGCVFEGKCTMVSVPPAAQKQLETIDDTDIEADAESLQAEDI